MNYFYYFCYLIYKAFSRIKSTSDSYKIYQTGLALLLIEACVVYGFLLPFFFPKLFNQIMDNRLYRIVSIFIIFIPNYILFRNEKYWMEVFSNFDKLPYDFRKKSGLIIFIIFIALIILIFTYNIINIQIPRWKNR